MLNRMEVREIEKKFVLNFMNKILKNWSFELNKIFEPNIVKMREKYALKIS